MRMMLHIEIIIVVLFIVNGVCSAQEPRTSLEFSTNIDGYLLSHEEFQFSSEYYCIEIRNLLKADKCEKQLIKIARACDSHPYEVLQVPCDPQLPSTVYVNDNVLIIDDFLFTDSLAHLNFVLEDGSCLKKTYLRVKPIPEKIREEECSNLKQKITLSKGKNTDFITNDLGKSNNAFDPELNPDEALKMRGIELDKPATFKMVKNVHYIIPKNAKRKRPQSQPSSTLQPQPTVEPPKPIQQPTIGNKNVFDFDASKAPVVDNKLKENDSQRDVKTNGYKSIQNSQDGVKTREGAEGALPGKIFDFDASEEASMYRKGKSKRLYSNSFCVKITPLYSDEGACEKELVHVSQDCNSAPFEVFKAPCILGSDFVSDNSLRLDNYLYSISTDTLVFALENGSCFKKVYNTKNPKPEPMDVSECERIKQRVARDEAEYNQQSADQTETVSPIKNNGQERSNVKQDKKEGDNGSQGVAVSKEYGDSEESKSAEEGIYILHQDKDQPSEGYQLNIKIPPEAAELPQEKDKRSALDSFIQHAKNPLRRLSRRKEDVKGFSVVLVYNKNEEA